MKKYTFKGGLHPHAHKELTKNKPIDKGFVPSKVVIPIVQHIGAPCSPKVKKGDKVEIGDVIASSEAFVSAPIHSSVFGTVLSLEEFIHPVLGKTQSIIIENDKKTKKWKEKTDKQVEKISIDKLKDIIKNAGLVGLGGAAFPSFVKLSPPPEKNIDTLVINGAECEPYLTCDYRVMLEYPDEFIKGIKIFAKILQVEKTIIGIETNKKDAIELLKNKLEAEPNIDVYALKEKYPQGGEKQLITATTQRKVPNGGLPMDVGVCVFNVGTCFSAYEAAYKDKPVVERALTVTGDAVNNPLNMLVPVGSLYSEIIEYCGGFKQPPQKLIMGGPMMGIAQYSLETPVIKGTSGILALLKDKSNAEKNYPCINCGKCVAACPMNLMPGKIYNLVNKDKYIELEQAGIKNCMECGVCTYTCPARKNIIQSIKKGKTLLSKKDKS